MHEDFDNHELTMPIRVDSFSFHSWIVTEVINEIVHMREEAICKVDQVDNQRSLASSNAVHALWSHRTTKVE
jgi:hypothetical protein